MTSRVIMLTAACVLGLALSAQPAFAYNEGGSTEPGKTDCSSCHADDYRKGPHGGYAVGTNKCMTCHSPHAATGSLLLPKETVTGTCFTCHDGSGGDGVYGAIAARGLTPGGGHQIDTTNVVPVGDSATGGQSSRAFSGQGGNLGCNDCHSPHDANTVEPFIGDRSRADGATTTVATSHLLRSRPTGAQDSSSSYGAKWCAGCHEGAANGTGGAHSHPSETSVTAGAYDYGSVPSLVSTTSTSTVLAPLGGSNLGYFMPAPRTPLQQGHAPLCQQCHEDSRSLGQLGTVAQFSVSGPNGESTADNPRFQGFPHETVNAGMLVETADDLCINCHPPAQLP